MKSVILKLNGLKFTSAFRTIVTKVIVSGDSASIVVDGLPYIEISLGQETHESLDIKRGSQVTIKPIEDSTDSFLLEVGKEEVSSKKAAAPTKSSSPTSTNDQDLENRLHREIRISSLHNLI